MPTNSPSATASPTQTATPRPTPTETQVARPPAQPERVVGDGLNRWLNRGTEAVPPQTENESAPKPQGPAVKFDTGGEVRFTEQGSLDLSVVKRTTPEQLVSERVAGFAPGSGIYIEVLGSRTGARFVVTTANLVDEVTLLQAIRNSIPAQAADFFSLSQARLGSEPSQPKPWTEDQREVAYDYFQSSGLELPNSLADLDFSDFSKWIQIDSDAEGYVPGTTVFLTLTSSPLVIAEATVNRNGQAELSGAIPVEYLQAGEHRVRLVGIRSLGGVSVDENGEIQLSEETLEEIRRFDLGTQATVRMGGKTADGDYLNAVRVVPLVPVAPWWTLWFILVGFLIAAVARRKNWSNTKIKYWLTVSLNLAAAIPAVIIGWLSTVTLVTWVGLGLGLLAAGLTVFVKPKRERQRQREDANV